jgi:hypothetical protein
MPDEKVVSSRKRLPISRHSTYESALAAKKAETRYPTEQLQIRRKFDHFALVARVSSKETN